MTYAAAFESFDTLRDEWLALLSPPRRADLHTALAAVCSTSSTVTRRFLAVRMRRSRRPGLAPRRR
jgi:hypothetical protein